MRISTYQINQSSVGSILNKQAELSEAQKKVSSGLKFLNPSDDPTASARVIDLEQSRKTTEQYQFNADAANTRLRLSEITLGNVVNQMQRFREIVIQANNGIQTDTDRRLLAVESREIFDNILGLSNTIDSNENYLFSGYQGNSKPFFQNANGSVTYTGDDGQRFLQVGGDYRVPDTDPGSDIFMNIRNAEGIYTVDGNNNSGTGVIEPGRIVDNDAYQGHTYTLDFTAGTAGVAYTVTDNTTGAIVTPLTDYTGGTEISFDGVSTSITGNPAVGDQFIVEPSRYQSLFTTMQNFIDGLETLPVNSEVSRSKFENLSGRTLEATDKAMENISGTEASIGARLSAIERQKGINEDYILQAKTTLSQIRDLDYAEGITDLTQRITALEAAQQSHVKIQGLSLFNYL